MLLIPTLELMDGKCVSLRRGRLEEPEIWHVDPVETAVAFADAGATWMHLTDIDGLAGGETNEALIAEIIRTARIPVQVGGGFRSRDRIAGLIDMGAGRVVVGTLGVQDPGLVRELAKFYPDQIVLAVDVFGGQIMSEGWRKAGAIDPEDYLRAYDDVPLAAVIVTDIDADIEAQEAQLGVISGLAAATRHLVLARGTVRQIDDIARLKYVPNISGALLGKALMSKDILLEDALAAARPDVAPTAEFL